jgi:hypothetical protein
MKDPVRLKNEALEEVYKYFNENVRKLPKDSLGKIDETAPGFSSNDVDALCMHM